MEDNSSSEASGVDDVSDSNSSNIPFITYKHTRFGSNICPSKFKGVVPQQNGNWGCQIYTNHQRIWLGTFKSEMQAAMAYDHAAIKLRNGDARLNFPSSNITIEEIEFQKHYATEAVLNMIKNGTYQSRFSDFVKTHPQGTAAEQSLKLAKAKSNRELTCIHLFQKELTPSDVGKLNRLVIPKKFALMFFPHISESNNIENVSVDDVNDVQLAFYDRSLRLWTFRYCYWKSSQSYVFTRGWNRFVKDKQLMAEDMISFFLCECRDEMATQTFCVIDVNKGNYGIGLAGEANQRVSLEMELRRHLEIHSAAAAAAGKDVKNAETIAAVNPTIDEAYSKGGIKLFGVQIN